MLNGFNRMIYARSCCSREFQMRILLNAMYQTLHTRMQLPKLCPETGTGIAYHQVYAQVKALTQ
jgi:hypothetical protein